MDNDTARIVGGLFIAVSKALGEEGAQTIGLG